MTVLIVEDEPTVAEMFQAALESRGHACLVAGSIEEAAWTVAVAQIDAMTLDLSLPDGDAVSWLESVAEDRPDLARRTTIVTGRYLTDAEGRRAAACGAGVLMKPVSVVSLVETVLDRAGTAVGVGPGPSRAHRLDSSTPN